MTASLSPDQNKRRIASQGPSHSLNDLEMTLDRLAGSPVYRQDILGTGGEGHHYVHLGTKHHTVAWFRYGWQKLDAIVPSNWDIHPHVERARCLGRSEAELGHGGVEVVCAVVMITFKIQKLVTIPVTGSNNCVVNPMRCILNECEDRPSLVRVHDVANIRNDATDMWSRVLHGHELVQIVSVESPSVNDLSAVSVDHLDLPSLPDTNRFSAAGRNLD